MHTYIQSLSFSLSHTHTQYMPSQRSLDICHGYTSTCPTRPRPPPSWSPGLPSHCEHGSGEGQAGLPPAHLALVSSPKDTSSVSSEGPLKVTVQSPGAGVQRHKEVGKGTASRTGPLRPQSLLALLWLGPKLWGQPHPHPRPPWPQHCLGLQPSGRT